MTIGIPRSLIYWKRPYFWENFFEELGFEVLLSPKTNKEIVEMGVRASDPETCFSQKVYWGHLLWLDEAITSSRRVADARVLDGGCNYLFIPRLKSNEDKLEYCPKFFGIPDVAKILVKTPILSETFDERKEKFEKTLKKIGEKLKKNKREIEKAVKKAFSKEKELKEKEKEDFFQKIKSQKRKIVLVSHPYNLYDDYVNLKTKEKLEKLDAEVILINEVPIDEKGPIGEWPAFHWEFGKEIAEKSDKILDYNIAGCIQISSFQCGCDAVLKEFVEKNFKKNKIPFLYLMIDEYTGEAGFQTRLEAFADTL